MTPLVKITITLEPDGTWSCTRERKDSGESASGFKTWQEVFEYIEAHEKTFQERAQAAYEQLKIKYPEPLIKEPWVPPDQDIT